jgi:hypothetical protein
MRQQKDYELRPFPEISGDFRRFLKKTCETSAGFSICGLRKALLRLDQRDGHASKCPLRTTGDACGLSNMPTRPESAHRFIRRAGSHGSTAGRMPAATSIAAISNDFQSIPITFEKIMNTVTEAQTGGDLWQMTGRWGVGSAGVSQRATVSRRGARGATRPTSVVPTDGSINNMKANELR